MTQEFNYRCDACNKTEPSKYNREHYVEPDGWYTLMDQRHNTAGHVCNSCATGILKGCFVVPRHPDKEKEK